MVKSKNSSQKSTKESRTRDTVRENLGKEVAIYGVGRGFLERGVLKFGREVQGLFYEEKTFTNSLENSGYYLVRGKIPVYKLNFKDIDRVEKMGMPVFYVKHNSQILEGLAA